MSFKPQKAFPRAKSRRRNVRWPIPLNAEEFKKISAVANERKMPISRLLLEMAGPGIDQLMN